MWRKTTTFSTEHWPGMLDCQNTNCWLKVHNWQHQADLNAVLQKHSSKQDIAVKVLLKCVHWLSVEDIPFLKYKSLLNLIHDLTAEEIDSIGILKNSTFQYELATTCSGLLESLSNVVEDSLVCDLQNLSFVTALADESTDIANNKRLVSYAQIISDDMKPSTRFLTNIEYSESIRALDWPRSNCKWVVHDQTCGKALKKWKKTKERRVYELKKMEWFVKLLTVDWIRIHFRRFPQWNHVMMCVG